MFTRPFQTPGLRALLPHVLASAVCVLLVAGLTMARGRGTLLFLVWNLFLAWIPYALSLGASLTLARGGRTRTWLPPLFVVWLLFLPNAPYIVTDFIHVMRAPPELAGVYALIVAAFAGTALVLGLASVRLMHGIVRARLGTGWARFVLANVFVLSGIGVYVGRVLRWNSWDVVLRPRELVATTLSAFRNLPEHLFAVGFSLGFALSLSAAYLVYVGRRQSEAR